MREKRELREEGGKKGMGGRGKEEKRKAKLFHSSP